MTSKELIDTVCAGAVERGIDAARLSLGLTEVVENGVLKEYLLEATCCGVTRTARLVPSEKMLSPDVLLKIGGLFAETLVRRIGGDDFQVVILPPGYTVQKTTRDADA